MADRRVERLSSLLKTWSSGECATVQCEIIRRKEVKTQTYMLLKTIYTTFKTVIELPETLFRSYRMSDKDVEVMDKKGYYYDANKRRFRKDPHGRRGWFFEIDWIKEVNNHNRHTTAR